MLCKKCENQIFTLLASICPVCETNEMNSCFKHCEACAVKLNKCSFCEQSLSQDKENNEKVS